MNRVGAMARLVGDVDGEGRGHVLLEEFVEMLVVRKRAGSAEKRHTFDLVGHVKMRY